MQYIELMFPTQLNNASFFMCHKKCTSERNGKDFEDRANALPCFTVFEFYLTLL